MKHTNNDNLIGFKAVIGYVAVQTQTAIACTNITTRLTKFGIFS